MAPAPQNLSTRLLINEDDAQAVPFQSPAFEAPALPGQSAQDSVSAPFDDHFTDEIADLRQLLIEPSDDSTAANNAQQVVAPRLHRRLGTLASAKRELVQFAYDLLLTLTETTAGRQSAVLEALGGSLTPRKLVQSIARIIVPEAVSCTGTERHNAQNQVGRVVAAMQAAQLLSVKQGQLAERIREIGSMGAFVKLAKDIEAAMGVGGEEASNSPPDEMKAKSVSAATHRMSTLRSKVERGHDVLFVGNQAAHWHNERGFSFCVVYKDDVGTELNGYLTLNTSTPPDVDELLIAFEEFWALRSR